MKRALVTGGNRGIGRAIAEGLIAQGHQVFIGCRDMDAGREVAKEIGAEVVLTDCASVPSLEFAFDLWDIDILINNAGVLPEGNIFDDNAATHFAYQTMLHAPYELMRLCRSHMEYQGWGRVVNVSSEWGSFAMGLDGGGIYGAAKAALNALTVTAARDFKPSVKVNAMCPGWVNTRMGGAGATRTPDQAADTALWLANLPEDGPTGGFFRDKETLPW